ncbi:MAG TPA: L-histidine N(alpha)-methyltransferase [Rhizomicrobium sp.]|nr:L-histidine N(alpha)-methyltransferase [Rhizomicrobium sp.]
MSSPDLIARHGLRERPSEFARALVEGLSATPKWLPCKFFYDAEGSALFDRICELPEYYPTRTETALLSRHAHEFADVMGPDVALIEFGAGALTKVNLILDALDRPRAYVPIDISGDYLRQMAARLKALRPSLEVVPVVADFTKPLALPNELGDARRIGFFPGSTIGNMDACEAPAFLRKAAAVLKGGGMLIGVDLIKDPQILHAAYNDAQGVTEAFNKNLLARANRELDAGFDLDRFAHYAFYNPRAQRIEMHLMSLGAQTVSVAGHDIAFADGETIHTENSHKYSIAGFRELATQAGFAPKQVWTDSERLFSLHWLEC